MRRPCVCGHEVGDGTPVPEVHAGVSPEELDAPRALEHFSVTRTDGAVEII